MNRHSLFRWFDLLLYTIICLLIWYILKGHIDTLIIYFYKFFNSKDIFVGFAAFFLGMFFICSFLYKFKCINPKHKANLYLNYPPLFASGLGGFSIILHFYIPNNYSILDEMYIYSIYFTYISLGMAICLLYFDLMERRRLILTDFNILNQESDNFPDLIRWAEFEAPIESIQFDRFNCKIQADRISEILLYQKARTVGLIGSFGSGKSSILNLVSLNLREKPNTIVCRIDGWGRSDEGISQTILALVIEKIYEHVDCSAIVTLPKDYYDALKHNKSPFGVLLSTLFNIGKDPFEQLSRLDEILIAISHNLIIFLEDIDRHETNKEIKEQMPALLDRLGKLENIGFVFAVGTQHGFSDILIRICDFHESIPTAQDFTKDFLELRTYLIENFIPEFNLSGEINSTLISSAGENYLSVLNKIVTTPRQLKQIIRKCFSIWKNLAGEVNLDDVIILTTIRYTQPKIFDYLTENAHKLKTYSMSSSSQALDEKRKMYLEKLNSISSANDYNSTDFEALLTMIFPLFDKYSSRVNYENERFQTIGKPTFTDYFSRYLREKISDEEWPDQIILKAIHEYKMERKIASIEHLFNDNGYLSKFSDLSTAVFESRDYLDFASNIFTEIRRKISLREIKKLNQEQDLPIFRVVLNFLRSNINFSEGNIFWILKELEEFLPLSLNITNIIYHQIITSGNFFRDSKKIKNLRQSIVNSARDKFNSPLILANCLKDDFPWSSRQFVVIDSHPNSGGAGFSGADWNWFAELILKAAELEPDFVVPHILFLFLEIQRDPGTLNISYNFDGNLAFSLFGKNKEKFFKAISTKDVTTLLDRKLDRYITHSLVWVNDIVEKIKENPKEPWNSYNITIKDSSLV